DFDFRFAAELVATRVAVTAVEDLPLEEHDRLALPVAGNVVEKSAPLHLRHRRQQLGELVRLQLLHAFPAFVRPTGRAEAVGLPPVPRVAVRVSLGRASSPERRSMSEISDFPNDLRCLDAQCRSDL